MEFPKSVLISNLHRRNNRSKNSQGSQTNNKPNPIMIILDWISVSPMHTRTKCDIETIE